MADGALVVGGVVVAVVVLVFVVLLLAAVKVVGPYQQGIRTMFGSYRGVLNPGLHFVSPLSALIRVDLRSQSVPMRSQTLLTRDDKVVAVQGELRFRVVDAPRSVFQTQDYRSDLLQQAELATQAEVRGHDLAALTSDPLAVNVRLAEAIGSTTGVWGLKVEAATVRLTVSPGGMPALPPTPLPSGAASADARYGAVSSRRSGG